MTLMEMIYDDLLKISMLEVNNEGVWDLPDDDPSSVFKRRDEIEEKLINFPLKKLEKFFHLFEPNNYYYEYGMINDLGIEYAENGEIEKAKSMYRLNKRFCLVYADCTAIAKDVLEYLKDKKLAEEFYECALEKRFGVETEEHWIVEDIKITLNELKNLELAEKLIFKYLEFVSNRYYERKDEDTNDYICDFIDLVDDIKESFDKDRLKEFIYKLMLFFYFNIKHYGFFDKKLKCLQKLLNKFYDKELEVEIDENKPMEENFLKIIEQYGEIDNKLLEKIREIK